MKKREFTPLQILKDFLFTVCNLRRKDSLITCNTIKKFVTGFTLVEVLIVVIIIGILATIGVPQFADSIEKAKGGEARAGLGHLQTGEKVFFAENEYYTTNLSNLDITLSQRYWKFTVTTPSSTTYTATASRSGGTRSGQTLTMDQSGTISGNWEFK